jgi:hypothetical protein
MIFSVRDAILIQAIPPMIEVKGGTGGAVDRNQTAPPPA